MLQQKSQTKLPSKDKESTSFPHDIAPSWFSTEVDYTVPINDKPTKSGFGKMGKSQTRRYWKTTEEILMKDKNEGMKK